MRVPVFVVLIATLCLPVAAAPLSVTSDFPGGSAAVAEIDQQERRIRVNPAEHPGRGWACWWYFRVDGITPGETITIDVGNAPWATPERAAFSFDNRRWQQTSPGIREDNRIVYHQQIDADHAWFAWGPPFVPSDAEALVQRIAAKSPHATAFVLCKTRDGRPTPAVRIHATTSRVLGQVPRPNVWIQARQHAWESGSSWAASGLLDWLVSDAPAASALRENVTITVVPIMDVDNVARGAGGKNQQPQDHNRDWTDRPHWKPVAAAQQAIRKADAEGAFDLFIDLHNPDAGARNSYFYIPPQEELSELGHRNLQRFLAAAGEQMTSPLGFAGRTVPSGAEYDPNWEAISKNWVARHCREHVVAVTLEIPWNTPHSTAAGYRRVGQELGQAIEQFVIKSAVSR